jgi:hypothetical protein
LRDRKNASLEAAILSSTAGSLAAGGEFIQMALIFELCGADFNTLIPSARIDSSSWLAKVNGSSVKIERALIGVPTLRVYLKQHRREPARAYVRIPWQSDH